MARPLVFAGFIVWLLALVSMLYCFGVVFFAGLRSGGFAKLHEQNPGWRGGGPGRIWEFASSPYFEHPHRALIVGGMRISLLLVILLSVAGIFGIRHMRKTGRLQSTQTMDK